MATWRHLIPRPVRRAASAYLAHRVSRSLQEDIEAMLRRDRPIVAGPWVGEVGFELLYWVPFLRWCAESLGVPRDRLIVMSRGGTASWYQPFSLRYMDVFDHVSAETFRDQHDARVRELGEQKQNRLTAFDREVVDAAMRRAAEGDWSLLHPSRMYDLLNPFWWGHQPVEWVHAHTHYARLSPPPSTDIPPLPERYTAVKFYFNECFPATTENRRFADDLLRTLAERGPVVALSTGLNLDDHGGMRVDAHGVRHLPEAIEPAQNLRVQSAVVAGAEAFVGTYGGFSYMAPFYGVKSLAFYSDRNGFSQKHLQVARSAFERIGVGGLIDVNGVGDHSLETLS
jgi:hypothetical protein